MSLTNKTKASSYKDLLQINNSNSGFDGTTRAIVDGEGTASSIKTSEVRTVIQGGVDSATKFTLKDADSNNLFLVDSTNDLVKAGIGQHIVNTNIKTFAMDWGDSNPAIADTWYGLNSTFNHIISNALAMGAGSTPATTFNRFL